jgi:polyhydroxyalkanoate synthesis repressor PhaR
MPPPVLIKKYGNRRLYDTGDSRYITLDELATKVRGGADVRVVDVQSGDDLTQATLAQIILESGTAARVLPVGLLTQLIRLSDDALAEFFSRYVTAALDLYVQAKRGVQAVAAYNPLAQIPMTATDALSRMWMASPFGQFSGGYPYPPGGRPPSEPPVAPTGEAEPAAAGAAPADADDVAALRREVEELKRTMREAAPALGKPGARRKRRGS